MKVTALWRHPLKAHGREPLERVTLIKGQAMPFDRHWAVAHENARIDGEGWQKCANFNRGARIAALQAITARMAPEGGLTLAHPDLGTVAFDPDSDTGAARFFDWVAPLLPEGGPAPVAIHRLPGRGYTDSPFPSLSLCNMASHHAVESLAGAGPLQPERWRGNIWFDGAEAWAEEHWIGKRIALGDAVLRIEEQITRCKATTVNTDTGERDVDTLAALRILGHQEFGVYATVETGGQIALGDRLEILQ